MSSQPTSNNHKTIKETLVNIAHVKNNYDCNSVKDLRDLLKIIKTPYTLRFLETIYKNSISIRNTLRENHKFLHKIGMITDHLYDKNDGLYTIEELLIDIDYITLFSCYMFHLYYVEMSKDLSNEDEKNNNRIKTIYNWSGRDDLYFDFVYNTYPKYSYKKIKEYKKVFNKPFSVLHYFLHYLDLIEQAYSGHVTDILITNFINNELIYFHNVSKDIETKRNLFHLLFIEIIYKIRNRNTDKGKKYKISEKFKKIIKDLNTMTGYGTDNHTYYYRAEYDEQSYFDMLYRIKRNLIGELNYEN
jgi:hypothetical protein